MLAIGARADVAARSCCCSTSRRSASRRIVVQTIFATIDEIKADGHDDAARRAERQRRAEALGSRLRARDRRGRAGGSARRLPATRACEKPIWASNSSAALLGWLEDTSMLRHPFMVRAFVALRRQSLITELRLGAAKARRCLTEPKLGAANTCWRSRRRRLACRRHPRRRAGDQAVPRTDRNSQIATSSSSTRRAKGASTLTSSAIRSRADGHQRPA